MQVGRLLQIKHKSIQEKTKDISQFFNENDKVIWACVINFKKMEDHEISKIKYIVDILVNCKNTENNTGIYNLFF